MNFEWDLEDGVGGVGTFIVRQGEQVGRLLAWEDGRWRVDAFSNDGDVNVLASGTSLSLKHGKQIAEAVWRLSRNGEP